MPDKIRQNGHKLVEIRTVEEEDVDSLETRVVRLEEENKQLRQKLDDIERRGAQTLQVEGLEKTFNRELQLVNEKLDKQSTNIQAINGLVVKLLWGTIAGIGTVFLTILVYYVEQHLPR